MDDKDMIIGILKQQRNQALDVAVEMAVQIAKMSQQTATDMKRIADLEILVEQRKTMNGE